MILSAIVAMAINRVIGRDNGLPWNIPADLKRFRKITTGHPVVMGRKTFESIGKPLPNRPNIVVSRSEGFRPEGVRVVKSLDEALAPYRHSSEEVFILGGGEIFKQTIDDVQRIYLTLIHQNIDGDTYCPFFKEDEFRVEFEEKHLLDPVPFSFINFQRK
ncbi:MAG: dihydrofolate reductase [Oligoflexia bacterium]|nr:dihydrofolate reductase [Oligoflexia bacterium]